MPNEGPVHVGKCAKLRGIQGVWFPVGGQDFRRHLLDVWGQVLMHFLPVDAVPHGVGVLY